MAKENILIYGIHAVSAVCDRYPELVLQIAINKDLKDAKVSPIYSAAKTHHIFLKQVSKQELDKVSSGNLHQGVIATCKAIPTGSMDQLQDIIAVSARPFLLVLDGVQDPHNLGACLRTANAMGVDAVIIPKNDSCGLTSVVHKVSCGAAVMTPLIEVGNLASSMEALAKAGIWFVGLDAQAQQELAEVDLTSPIAIVMGAEGEGMRRLTRDKCDFLVKLPMFGAIESLNVSVATGMSLYEVVKQRVK
jgi:23S rRNA (guanosine2251-2'-O)-methyltransferase